jgi:geranylgeranyl transferase type-2 subunit beta
MKRSGTNPTAAAVGVLQLLGCDVPTGVIEFLADMPSSEGGLRANSRIPLADLLSTFTGAWTLARLDALDRLDPDAMRHFAEALTQPDGGFRGGLWDERADVEYTFYGLGVLGLFPSSAA